MIFQQPPPALRMPFFGDRQPFEDLGARRILLRVCKPAIERNASCSFM